MPKNKNITNIFNKYKPYLFGVLRGFIVFFGLYLCLSLVMYKTNSESKILYCLMFAFIILGGFICGAYVYKKGRGRGFLTGLLSTVPYSLLVFLVICIINGFTVSGDIFLVFLLALSGGFLGGVTAANTKI